MFYGGFPPDEESATCVSTAPSTAEARPCWAPSPGPWPLEPHSLPLPSAPRQPSPNTPYYDKCMCATVSETKVPQACQQTHRDAGTGVSTRRGARTHDSGNSFERRAANMHDGTQENRRCRRARFAPSSHVHRKRHKPCQGGSCGTPVGRARAATGAAFPKQKGSRQPCREFCRACHRKGNAHRGASSAHYLARCAHNPLQGERRPSSRRPSPACFARVSERRSRGDRLAPRAGRARCWNSLLLCVPS